jgi:F-type H+-transporting ATPase subunit delta
VKNLVIAKRYAKALFNIAREDKAVVQYGEGLAGFMGTLRQFPELSDSISNPFYPEDARKKVFESIAAKLEMNAIVKQFMDLLIEKGRIDSLGDICDYYHKLVDEHLNIARAHVSAAVKLDDEAMKNIAKTLGKITGKEVVVEFERNPALIGGVIARIGDLVIDGSVRTQLQNIKESLKRGELG